MVPPFIPVAIPTGSPEQPTLNRPAESRKNGFFGCNRLFFLYLPVLNFPAQLGDLFLQPEKNRLRFLFFLFLCYGSFFTGENILRKKDFFGIQDKRRGGFVPERAPGITHNRQSQKNH